MSLIPILFISIIVVSVSLHLYSTWALTREQNWETSTEESPLALAKRKQRLLNLFILRHGSPVVALSGILWGVIWVWLTFGLWSIQFALFILALVMGYILTYAVLIRIMFKLLNQVKS